MIFAIEWIGGVAGFLTTAAFLPQAIKAWRTRSTGDISILMFLALTAGITLWLVYGILLNDIPLIVANTVTLAIAVSIIIAKKRFG